MICINSLRHFLFTALLISFCNVSVAQSIDIPGPFGSGKFGKVNVLTNGNFVVADLNYSESGLTNIGAVYLYNGITHAIISVLKGSTTDDHVGQKVNILANGNFVVTSVNWHKNSISTVGAVTWVNGTTGLSGVVSSGNSLVGSTDGDAVGTNFIGLFNGNYVTSTPTWNNGGSVQNAGAATWCNGSTGRIGIVSASNSLVGGLQNYVGMGLTLLSNSNYIVTSEWWGNSLNSREGAVTWCNGTSGKTGTITSGNSLLGTTAGDYVGSGQVWALANGNYVIVSPNYKNGAISYNYNLKESITNNQI